MASHEHVFGNVSTDLKLSMVEAYLRAFTTALQDKPSPSRRFELWYIDAFAGTGERTVKLAAREAGLWEPSVEAATEARRGSARIAIETTPSFDRLIFMERKRKHVAALQELKSQHPNRDISIVKGDANQAIQSATNWSGWKNTRAVMFLDPYGMGVDWETLKAIRETRAIDVWYLVSLSGLYRQATHKGSNLDEKKQAALTRMLGTDEWKTAWYAQDEQRSFVDMEEPDTRRTADLDRMERYVTNRLGVLFDTVLGPKRLFNDRNAPMFSLYFLMANPSAAARKVATPIANHILKSGISSQVRP